MAVSYQLEERENKLSEGKEKKFYARCVQNGVLSFEEICAIISDRGTATKGDALVVIDGFLHTMIQGLREGKIIDLGDFGRFQISVSSQGAEKKEEFTQANITHRRILFRPGRALRDMVKTLQFASNGIVRTLLPPSGEEGL